MARVLIVDDEKDVTDSLSQLLSHWGHETRKAYDGKTVIQQAIAFQPQIVLLDIGLPNLDGYEVAQQLRHFKSLAGLKIAAVTGRSSPEDVQKSKHAGIDAHFVKPVDSALLKAFLDDAIKTA